MVCKIILHRLYVLLTLIFICRQVTPSEDNYAPNCLSETVQRRNVRRVKVNAQVTFVIYVVECVANWSIGLFWIFINKKSSNMTGTLGLFWFHVILPYIFLMNTSHNKNLVIDDGWLTTVKNTFGVSENFSVVSFQLGSCLFRSSTLIEMSQIEGNHKMDKNNERSKVDTKTTETNADIYVISKSVETILLSEKETVQPINVPSEMPSSSNVESNKKYRHKKINITNKKVSESDEDRNTPQKSERLCVGEQILSNMLIHINNEEYYLHYLKQLSRFEAKCSKGVGLHEEFNTLQITHLPAPKIFRIKNSNFQSKDQPNTKHKKNGRYQGKSKNSSDMDDGCHYNLIGKVSDRLEVRKNLFDSFQGCRDNEERYKRFVEKLFDIEERFTFE